MDPVRTMMRLGLTQKQADRVVGDSFSLVVFTTTTHADWDWILPFPVLVTGDRAAQADSGAGGYFAAVRGMGPSGPVAAILSRAARRLEEDPEFRYSFTEVGFLRAFAQREPAALQALVDAGDRVHLAGAGITSADSQLSHGEAFVRNYLLGRAWAAAALPGATISQCYVPDDFGHDRELPATLRAMGIDAVAFARLPGNSYANQSPMGKDNPDLQAPRLVDASQIDFSWRAADGSGVLAHFLASFYFGSPPSGGFPTAESLLAYLNAPLTGGGAKTILSASPTRYVYVGFGGDLQYPMDDLPKVCRTWNASNLAADNKIYCVTGSFDDFAGLLASVPLPELPTATESFDPEPYYCGTQVTRPELKVLHQRAVRALLAAEAFGALAGASGLGMPSDPAAIEALSATAALDAAWNLVAPSTHHDFITGTAHPQVYRTEELPLLQAAVARAEWLRDAALASTAALVQPADDPSQAALAVFNQLGFERVALAEVTPDLIGDAAQVECDGTTAAVQTSFEGKALFPVAVPPLGYARVLSAAGQPGVGAGAVQVTMSGAGVTLANGTVSALLDDGTGALAELREESGANVLAPGEVANEIAVFTDGGNEYVLGCEMKNPGTFADLGGTQAVERLEVLESGPHRALVRVTSSYAAADLAPITFVRDYSLVAGEPLLRMSLTGSAPLAPTGDGTTVFVKFPFALGRGRLDGLVRGTPMHWTGAIPQTIWDGITLYACHHFAMPTAGGMPLGALLHADVPGWGLNWSNGSNDGSLYGGVLRNTTGDVFAAFASEVDFGRPWVRGVDPEAHTRRYALLVPSACGDASTGAPLRAALGFACAPLAAAVNGILAPRDDPPGRSLAWTSAGPAMVTAAKLGTLDPKALVIRLYQPTNAPLPGVELSFEPRAVPGGRPDGAFVAVPVTALEEPIDAAAYPVSGATATVDMPNAVASVAVTAL